MVHVVITGCNRGIGASMMEDALVRGWQVTGTVRTEAQRAKMPKRNRLEIRVCDMKDIAGIPAAFAGLLPVDILINNAGVIGPETPMQSTLSMDFEGFAETLRINTLAPLAVAQACLPAMSEGGRILSVSSQMAYMGNATSDRIAYRASKAALNKVMQGLATDLDERGIAVVPVDPGWVRTDMGGEAADQSPADVAEGILDIATRLRLEDSGRFFRFTGEERDY